MELKKKMRELSLEAFDQKQRVDVVKHLEMTAKGSKDAKWYVKVTKRVAEDLKKRGEAAQNVSMDAFRTEEKDKGAGEWFPGVEGSIAEVITLLEASQKRASNLVRYSSHFWL